ncbi:MAG: hypothetical protein LWW86_03875 [Micrococcales bacterium]|nr:hypothetical protein [Micrococcales bacterium]
MSSTLTRPEARPQEYAVPAPPGGSSFAQWLASWTVALRMARRDVRRHRGRSALVVVMVMLPVAILIAAAATLFGVNATDLDKTVGSAQARISWPQPTTVMTSPSGNMSSGGMAPAANLPGQRPSQDATVAEMAAALSTTLGGSALPVFQHDTRWVDGERRRLVTDLALDARVGLGDKAELTSGRWAESESEAVVTPEGERRGIPTSGRITVQGPDGERELTIVGTAKAYTEWGGMPALVVLPTQTELAAAPGASGAGPSFLLVREAPVTWAEVKGLWKYGITTTSRHVAEHPPTESEIPAEVRGDDGGSQESAFVVLLGALLFVVVGLMVAPAFGVGIARQRRALALSASNGATTPALRRTVLSQAVVLGGIGAALGVGAGLLAPPALSWAIAQVRPDVWLPTSRPPWWFIAFIAGCALLSTFAAALAPALRLGRLDIVGVMRGQAVSPPLSRTMTLAGAVLAALGGLATIGCVVAKTPEIPVVVAMLVLFLGAVLLVPACLVLCGGLGRLLPVSLRMAARDAARQRTRSGPTVAAVMGAVAVLTVFGIALTSDTAQRAKEYSPRNAPGRGMVTIPYTLTDTGAGGDGAQQARRIDAEIATVTTTVQQQIPGATLVPISRLGKGDGSFQPGVATPVFGVQRPGCSASQTVDPMATPPTGMTVPGADPSATSGVNPCLEAGTTAMRPIRVVPAATIIEQLGLTGAEAAAVRDGAAVVLGTHLATGDKVNIVSAQQTSSADGSSMKTTDMTTTPMKALVRTTTSDTLGRMLGAGMFLSPETVDRLGWPTVTDSVLVRGPDGDAISKDEQQRVNELLADDEQLWVERGFERDDFWPMAILAGFLGLLALVVTLTSTALSLSEQQSLQSTFAAVGATRWHRRLMAGAEAAVTSTIGSGLGLLVGLAPGIAMAIALTRSGYDPLTGAQVADDPIIQIPWPLLLGVALAVPVVAAFLASIAIRREPGVTRRLS